MKTVNLTTKKQKHKKQSPLKWVVMMIVLIFLFIFGSNKIVAESYTKFKFFEDEQFQYLDYLPISNNITISVIDSGGLDSSSEWDLTNYYNFETGSSDVFIDDNTHGSGVSSIIHTKHLYQYNFKGLFPTADFLFAQVDTWEEDQGASATEWSIQNGAQIINYSFVPFAREAFIETINTGLLENDSLFIITAGGNNNSTSWGSFSDDVWSIAGLDDTQESILDGYCTIEDNSNIKFSAPAEDIVGYSGAAFSSSGTSYSSPLFAAAVGRILGANNSYTRDEMYNLLVSYGTEIDGGGYKIRWKDLVETEFGISKESKVVKVLDLDGNEMIVNIDLIYQNGNFLKSYLTTYEIDNVIYKINKELQ